MYHSFVIYSVLKTMKSLNMIDNYIESGVFFGITTQLARRY